MAAARLAHRPLDWVRSIKVKLGLVVVGSVAVTVGAIFGSRLRRPAHRYAFVGGLVVSLVMIQLLAHGMVAPLREMVAATKAMASGDYRQRVRATGQDEVGSLARSFNTMAARLDEVEQQRRELLANVSHELRTPVAALRARLENLADGVEVLDGEAVATMLKGDRAAGPARRPAAGAGPVRVGRASGSTGMSSASATSSTDAAAEVRPVNSEVRIVTEIETAICLRRAIRTGSTRC